MSKQYEVFMDSERLLGTAEEMGRGLCELRKLEVRLGSDRDGDIAYYTRPEDPEDDDAWQYCGTVINRGSSRANLDAAYEALFLDWLDDGTVDAVELD